MKMTRHIVIVVIAAICLVLFISAGITLNAFSLADFGSQIGKKIAEIQNSNNDQTIAIINGKAISKTEFEICKVTMN